MESLFAAVVYYICLLFFVVGGLGALFALASMVWIMVHVELKRYLPILIPFLAIYSFIGVILYKVMAICHGHM